MRIRKSSYLCFSATLLLLLVHDQCEAGCVRLSECKQLDWMMRNKDNIPGVTSSQVQAHINSLKCGSQGQEPKVNCSNVESTASPPSSSRTHARSGPSGMSGRQRSRGGMTNHVPSWGRKYCRGSIRLYQMVASQGSLLGSVRATRFRGGNYPNIRRYVRRGAQVVGLQNSGSCCWSAHSRLAFRGASQVLGRGVESRPIFQPKSLRKLPDC